MDRRSDRINHTIRRELGALITEEMSDPRLPQITSITKVVCSSDMQEARISVSVLGSPEDQKKALIALQSAAGFLRRELGDKIRMKQVPRLTFQIDTAIKDAADMVALINSVVASDLKHSGRPKSP